MGRIVKQYQEALKLLAAGRPIPRKSINQSSKQFNK